MSFTCRLFMVLVLVAVMSTCLVLSACGGGEEPLQGNETFLSDNGPAPKSSIQSPVCGSSACK